MDTKKILKPELKEIYERVMSTKAIPRTTAPAEQPKESPPNPPAPPPTTQSNEKPKTPDIPAATPEPYLASSSPRAVPKDTGTFVYSSHGKNNSEIPKEEKNEDTKTIAPAVPASNKEELHTKNSLLPVLMIIMAIFLIIYTVFWAIYLNII